MQITHFLKAPMAVSSLFTGTQALLRKGGSSSILFLAVTLGTAPVPLIEGSQLVLRTCQSFSKFLTVLISVLVS